MRKRSFIAVLMLLFVTLVVVSYLTFSYLQNRDGSKLKQIAVQTPEISCKVYIINESDNDSSQLITIDPKSKEIDTIGQVYTAYEFAGLNFHPQTQALYTNTTKEGDFYLYDTTDGTISFIATSNLDNITSLTFHPIDGSLWGFSEERGIVTIDPETAQTELVVTTVKTIGSLGWSNDGKVLYGSDEDGSLFAYHPATRQFSLVSDNLLEESIGFTMLNNGLLFGIHSNEDSFVLYTYDLKNLEISDTINFNASLDPQGIAWLKDCGNPF